MAASSSSILKQQKVLLNKLSKQDLAVAVRSFGRADSIQELTLAILTKYGKSLLDKTYLLVCPEDPDFESYLQQLDQVWLQRLLLVPKGADKIAGWLEQQMAVGSHVVILDDNISKLFVGGKLPRGNQRLLEGLVRQARDALLLHHGHAWSISPTANTFWSKPASTIWAGAGLLYGAIFGLDILQDSERYTKYGQVRDDFERSCRYIRKDGCIVRLNGVQVQKRQKPGVFGAGKGGISSSLGSAAAHEKEKRKAEKLLVTEFPELVQLNEDPGIQFIRRRQQALVPDLPRATSARRAEVFNERMLKRRAKTAKARARAVIVHRKSVGNRTCVHCKASGKQVIITNLKRKQFYCKKCESYFTRK